MPAVATKRTAYMWNITAASLGTEELAHLEIICAIVHQLTRNLTPDEIVASGFDKYYVDHTLALWPQAAGGIPFNACEFQSKGDPITDLTEDMAAEQKARTTYDNILRLVKDPEVCDPIRFLREREIVHFQRFGDSKLTNLRSFGAKKRMVFIHAFFYNNFRNCSSMLIYNNSSYIPNNFRITVFTYHNFINHKHCNFFLAVVIRFLPRSGQIYCVICLFIPAFQLFHPFQKS